MDFAISTAARADAPAILALVHDAFGGEEETSIVEQVWTSAGYRPALDLIAEAKGEIVGHILLSRGDLAGTPALGLAPLAVSPAWQRRGVGSIIVRAAIERAKAAGERWIMLLGSPRYYGRFGFEPAGRYGITAANWSPLDPADFQILRLDGSLPPAGAYRYAWEL